MALVVLVGIPLSGKTKFAERLKVYLDAQPQTPELAVKLVSDDDLFGQEKAQAYSTSQIEKSSRLKVKDQVERQLTPQTVVICDSMNYIKGFRFELNVLSRTFGTEYCTVHLNTPLDVCLERNEQADPMIWREEDIRAIHARMETPSETKFELPVIPISQTADADLDASLASLADLIFGRKRLLRSRFLNRYAKQVSSQEILSELSRVSNDIVKVIARERTQRFPGDLIKVHDGTDERFVMKSRNIVTLPRLRRLRKTFLREVESDPPESLEEIPGLFVVFLNSRTRQQRQ